MMVISMLVQLKCENYRITEFNVLNRRVSLGICIVIVLLEYRVFRSLIREIKFF